MVDRVSQRRIGRALSVVAFVVIAVATLTPHSGAPATESVWCIACGELGGVDVIANILLFMPLGLGLALALRRRWTPVLLCLAFTVLVESLQIRVVSGRDASASDVLANTIGGWLGTELGLCYARVVFPEHRLARRLVVGWAALLLAVLGLTSWGFAASSRPLSIWIQHTPARAGYEPFRGTLDAFEIEGIPLSESYPKRGRPIAEALVKRFWRATATVTTRGPSAGPTIIARIVEESTTRLSVEQSGADLRCRVKTRASDLRLRDPMVAVNGAFVSPGVVVRATCGRLAGSLLAAATTNTTSAEDHLRLSPSLGWVTLSPFVIAVTPAVTRLGLAWLFLLMAPAGYWLAAARRTAGPSRRFDVLVPALSLAVALGAGLYALPVFFDVSAATGLEWAASLVGLAGGAAVQRLVAGDIARPNEIRRPQQVVAESPSNARSHG